MVSRLISVPIVSERIIRLGNRILNSIVTALTVMQTPTRFCVRGFATRCPLIHRPPTPKYTTPFSLTALMLFRHLIQCHNNSTNVQIVPFPITLSLCCYRRALGPTLLVNILIIVTSFHLYFPSLTNATSLFARRQR